MIKMGKIAQRILTVYSGIVYNKNRYEKYSKKNYFMQIYSLLKRKCKEWFESRQEAQKRNMTLLTYQVFKTVADQGSFRKAADIL